MGTGSNMKSPDQRTSTVIKEVVLLLFEVWHMFMRSREGSRQVFCLLVTLLLIIPLFLIKHAGTWTCHDLKLFEIYKIINNMYIAYYVGKIRIVTRSISFVIKKVLFFPYFWLSVFSFFGVFLVRPCQTVASCLY